MRESELLEGNRFLRGTKKIHNGLLSIVRLYDQLEPAHVQNASALVGHWPRVEVTVALSLDLSQLRKANVFKPAQPLLKLHSCLRNFCGVDSVDVRYRGLLIITRFGTARDCGTAGSQSALYVSSGSSTAKVVDVTPRHRNESSSTLSVMSPPPRRWD